MSIWGNLRLLNIFLAFTILTYCPVCLEQILLHHEILFVFYNNLIIFLTLTFLHLLYCLYYLFNGSLKYIKIDHLISFCQFFKWSQPVSCVCSILMSQPLILQFNQSPEASGDFARLHTHCTDPHNVAVYLNVISACHDA